MMRSAFGQSLVLLVLTAIAAALTGWLHPRAPNYAPRAEGERSPLAISWQEVAELPADAVLWIDARTEAEFGREHIPGAVLLNEDTWQGGFDAFIMAWSPEQTVIAYCDAAACHASEAVAQRLRRELGGGEIYFLEGGWQAWQAHN